MTGQGEFWELCEGKNIMNTDDKKRKGKVKSCEIKTTGFRK